MTSHTNVIFGQIIVGGSLSGAQVRDIRLGNELARRGYPVHVWWVLDQPDESPFHAGVTEHLLVSGFRYYKPHSRWWNEQLGRLMRWYWPDAKRLRSLQKRPHIIDAMMRNYLRLIAEGIEDDPIVLQRFVRGIEQTGVTHLLPMIEALGAYAHAAKGMLSRPVKQLITFQGYELYVNYARAAGIEQPLYAKLRQIAEGSDYPAITVSADYARRVVEDIGISADRLVAIPPGIPTQATVTRQAAPGMLAARMKDYDPSLPLVCYLGRQDVEKGIDLLLYAAKMLKQRGLKFQLAICGPTLFGDAYSRVIRQLAEDLRLDVLWWGYVDEQMRGELFAASRCVVYPSIHREPFGMVAVEAAVYGTPAVVPDYGGIAEAIHANGKDAGLRFKVWDCGDLADQIARMLTDDALWRQLSGNGPAVADYYSITRLADRVLAHMGLNLHA